MLAILNMEDTPLNDSPAGGPSGFTLHTLIPLEEFKAILGIDDREDCLDFASVRNQDYEFSQNENSTHLLQPPSLAAFCLTTATFTIEQYCKRRFFLKKHFERIEFYGDLLLPLREYPVREVLAVYIVGAFEETGELIETDLYRVIPDLEGETGEGPEDTVYTLSLSPALNRGRGFSAVKAVYRAGYACGEAPPDLASACLELAAWNMSRYRGRRIGMTGNVRGNGKDWEHLEASMPENVRLLLEPYKRRTI
ncbi:MAG: hypothetical protein LBD47_06570 [Treponema sp.]|jgi:hypothetical protein|nr:hypothetical protein [Treponema sp.]